VMQQLGDMSRFAMQREQLGTAHAVMQAEDFLNDEDGTTIVVCGDTPLMSSDTYEALFEHHERSGAQATILTTKAPDATGHGRVVRNNGHEGGRGGEHEDATDDERMMNEINTGRYCFDNKALLAALQDVSNESAQGEYYLPDVIEIMR